MMAPGVEPDAEFAVKGPFLTVQSGTLLAGDAAQPQVLLGADLARSLKATPGSSLTLLASTTEGAMNAMDVVVAGTFSTGVPDVDKRAGHQRAGGAATAGHAAGVQPGRVLDRMESIAAARERLAQQFALLQVQTWEQQAFFYRSVRDLYNRIFGALGVVIVVIVVFVVTNAMAMAVIERTREIGTLRALGTLPAQLLRSLGLEGMLLGGAGALSGAAGAGGVVAAVCVSCGHAAAARGAAWATR